MTGTDTAFDEVARRVGARTGLAFPEGRRAGLELGVRRAMERAGIGDVARYAGRLDADPALWDDLIAELAVGETYFFREPAHFEFIRRVVLPDVRRRRGAGHAIRAWSAGCASGEEAYSLAMLLDEAGLAGRSHVVATDLSPTAIDRARRATYRPWSLRGDGAIRARPYLRRDGEQLVVAEAIRRRIAFRTLNLVRDAYPTFATGTWGMDLILCRNVLLYFDPEAVAAVARRLVVALADGGWLITASSDPPLAADTGLEAVATKQGVFYRRGPATPALVGEPAGPDDPGAGGPAVAAAVGCEAAKNEEPAESAEAAALHVRELAGRDVAAAERAAAEALARQPLSGELHYLRAALLWDLGRDDEAAASARRAIYLDRSLAVAHVLLGSILRGRGDREGARRAFRNARDLCEARPPDEPVPLGDGESAGRLAESARVQLARLDGRGPEEDRR